MNIIGEQGALSSGFLPSMSSNIHISDRHMFRQAVHMTKESQLSKFCEAVDGSIWRPIDSPDVRHDSIAGRAKRIDFLLHVLRDDP